MSDYNDMCDSLQALRKARMLLVGIDGLESMYNRINALYDELYQEIQELESIDDGESE